MISLLILAFIAGVLTVAAPCILPLLPVVLGGVATARQDAPGRRAWTSPLLIAGGLAVSIVLFTLLLKATTALLGVPQAVWNVVAGGIVFLFGLNLLFPVLWEKAMIVSGLHVAANRWMGASYQKRGALRDVLMGAALGPVFSSCSPTYALIVAVVLPTSFATGLLYLVAYALGLAATLMVIATLGQAAVKKLGWLSNPHGWFRRVVGVLFVVVGLAVVFGLDRKLQAYVLDQGWYDPIMRLEQRLDIQ